MYTNILCVLFVKGDFNCFKWRSARFGTFCSRVIFVLQNNSHNRDLCLQSLVRCKWSELTQEKEKNEERYY